MCKVYVKVHFEQGADGMKFFRSNSIQTKFIFGAVAAGFVILSFVVGLLYFVGSRILVQEILDGVAYSTRYSVEQVDRWFTEKRVRMNTILYTFPILADDAKKKDVLEQIYDMYGDGFLPYIGFSDGTAMFGDRWIPDPGWDPTARPWYIAAMENKADLVFVPPYIDATT